MYIAYSLLVCANYNAVAMSLIIFNPVVLCAYIVLLGWLVDDTRTWLLWNSH